MTRSKRQLAVVQRSQTATFDAYDRLVGAGIPRQRIRILAPGDTHVAEKMTPRPERAVLAIVVGAAIGFLGGALVGAIVCLALFLFAVGLFVAQPVVAAAVIVAYAASAGSFVGALIGTRFRRSAVAAGVQDAVDDGRWVVVVHAKDAEQRALAERVLANEPLSLSRAA